MGKFLFKFLNKIQRSLVALRGRSVQKDMSETRRWRLLQVESAIACNLRCIMCPWREIAENVENHGLMSPEIWQSIRPHLSEIKSIDFTGGGEPLLQGEVVDLMEALLADGRTVLLETSGALGHDKLVPLAKVPAGVHRIVDLKPPGSGISADLMDRAGISCLGSGDEVKIVCATRADYEWGRDLVRSGDLIPVDVLATFSPVQGALEPRDLAEWILADGLDVCFQIQLHRAVWPEIERGV